LLCLLPASVDAEKEQQKKTSGRGEEKWRRGAEGEGVDESLGVSWGCRALHCCFGGRLSSGEMVGGREKQTRALSLSPIRIGPLQLCFSALPLAKKKDWSLQFPRTCTRTGTRN
jgi:hypothetical protein